MQDIFSTPRVQIQRIVSKYLGVRNQRMDHSQVAQVVAAVIAYADHIAASGTCAEEALTWHNLLGPGMLSIVCVVRLLVVVASLQRLFPLCVCCKTASPFAWLLFSMFFQCCHVVVQQHLQHITPGCT
jgi:hypothetical protein